MMEKHCISRKKKVKMNERETMLIQKKLKNLGIKMNVNEKSDEMKGKTIYKKNCRNVPKCWNVSRYRSVYSQRNLASWSKLKFCFKDSSRNLICVNY